jgi:hypothetical protein
MIKMIKISSLLVFVVLLNSCASSYRRINPDTIKYASKSMEGNILLEYRYDLLERKYKKKETRSNIKLMAVKITNNTDKEIVLGRDFKLSYDDGKDVAIIQTERLFQTLRQRPASYLWYLLLTPAQLYSGTTTTSNGYNNVTTPATSFPIGLILGPGIAAGNLIGASAANKNFKNELIQFDLIGKTIGKGETVYGLIGSYSNRYESIKIKVL